MLEQGPSVAAAAEFWADVQVLEMKARFSQKRREVVEEDGQTHSTVALKSQDHFGSWSGAKQRCLKLLPSCLDLMAQLFEGGQSLNQFQDQIDVFHRGLPQRGVVHGVTFGVGRWVGNGQLERDAMNH